MEPTNLFFGKYTISSERSTQQGEPLGPVLYSLMTLVNRKEFKVLLKLLFLGDTFLAGQPQGELEGVATIVEKAEELGLMPNFDKCKVFVAGGSPGFAANS